MEGNLKNAAQTDKGLNEGLNVLFILAYYLMMLFLIINV
jgi:hypothetical protein